MRITRIKIFFHLTLFTAFLATNAKAQMPQYSFQTTLSHDTIRIGDQVEFKVTANVPKGYNVLFPNFADTLATGVELLNASPIDTQVIGSDRVELIYRMLITSFDSGLHRIPSFALPFGEKDITDTAKTSNVWLTVLTLPRDTAITTIYDIKPPLAEPITFGEVVRWAGLFLLIVGLIALVVYYFVRRKQNKPIIFFEKPVDPAHVIALKKLKEVTDGKMWVTDDHKHYHSVVTEIVREYIEGRFEVPALEQTTLEILQTIKSKNIVGKELQDFLYENLSLSDLVKFAKYVPTVSENEELLKFAYRFVNDTKPVEVEKEVNVEPEKVTEELVDKSELPSDNSKIN
jgi:hypothetical protein